jgi:hypothetical protein
MDFQGTAGKEVAALQSRQQYLGTMAEQRCGAVVPLPVQALPAASVPPTPVASPAPAIMTPAPIVPASTVPVSAPAATPIAPDVPATQLNCADPNGARFVVIGAPCPPPSTRVQ